MNRKSFLANSLMAIAVSLVPKILQPFIPEISEEELVDVPIVFKRHFIHYDKREERIYATWEPTDAATFSLRMPKKQAEIFIAECNSKNQS